MSASLFRMHEAYDKHKFKIIAQDMFAHQAGVVRYLAQCSCGRPMLVYEDRVAATPPGGWEEVANQKTQDYLLGCDAARDAAIKWIAVERELKT